MAHQFTAVTPMSSAGQDLIQVSISFWEIECCAPPPTIGQPSTWAMSFVAAPASGRTELDRDEDWEIRDLHNPRGAPLAARGVVAFWPDTNGPPPDPGHTRVTGHLTGTVHALVPDELPRVTGVVHRIQVVSQQFAIREQDNGRVILPISGTWTLRDMRRSPRTFDAPTSWRASDQPAHTGVLIDLLVDCEGQNRRIAVASKT